MVQWLKRLNKRIDYDVLDDNEARLMYKLVDLGVAYETEFNGYPSFRLCKNTSMKINGDSVEFEVYPNRYIGIFFENDEIFECISDDKIEPEIYGVTYALNPDQKMVENFGLGSDVRVKVIARGYNENNEGLLVRLPGREGEFYSMSGKPCITIGLKDGAKSKNTSSLDFNEEIKGVFLQGYRGLAVNGQVYFNLKDVKDVSTTYCVTHNRETGYKIDKIKEKKLYSR